MRVSSQVNIDRLYDVCLSFAGEQREYVDRVAGFLASAGVRVFYDRYETANLWGEDLLAHFDNVYRKCAKFCLMFVSADYAQKVWTTHECRSAQARAIHSTSAYILPVRFDDTEIPGLLETVGFLNANDLTPDQIANFVVAKLNGPKGSATVRTLEYAPRSSTAYHQKNANQGPLGQIVAEGRPAEGAHQAGLPNRIVASQLYSMTTVFGRERVLGDLTRAFFDGIRLSANRPTVQVLAGIGGIGKTSIARVYGAQNQDLYDLIWWIRAEDPELVVADFRGLLYALGLPDVERINNPIQLAHVQLSNRRDRWLLVFDNLAQQADMRGFVPPDGLGDIIVTSRSSTWSNQSMVIHVTPLANEVGVRLLLDISRDDNKSAAAELVDELGGLPLALQQAASYVSENPIDLVDYLRLYREHRPSLHQKGTAPDYDFCVGTTWEVSFHMLPDTARSVLNVLSWCSPEEIPLDLLVQPEPIEVSTEISTRISDVFSNELDYFNAVGTLAGYGLITITGRDASVHRLIQAVTRDNENSAGELESWAMVTASLLLAAVPQPPANADRVTRWLRLRPHFQHYLRITPLQDYPTTLRLRHWMAQWAGELGRPMEATDMFANLIELQTHILGRNHDDTLCSRHSLAQWTGEAGELDDAIRLFDALIADRSQISGSNHPETLRAVHSSAYWIGESGSPTEACGRLQEVLSRRERVLGVEHPDTLRTKHSLAFRTGQAGEPDAACEMLSELLPVRTRVLGPDHPHTLRTRYSLAEWVGRAGDPSKAKDMTSSLLLDQTRSLGAEHPHTLRTRYNLAQWTGAAGDTETHIESLITLLVDQDRILGPDHPDTRQTRNSLSGLIGDTSLKGENGSE